MKLHMVKGTIFFSKKKPRGNLNIHIYFVWKCPSPVVNRQPVIDINLYSFTLIMSNYLQALSVSFADRASQLVASECSRSVDIPEKDGDGVKATAQVNNI